MNPNKSWEDRLLAAGTLVIDGGLDISSLFGVGDVAKGVKFLVKFGMKYGKKLLASEGRKELANVITKGLNQFGEGVRNGTEKLLGRGYSLGNGFAFAGAGGGRTFGFSMEKGGQMYRFSRGLNEEAKSKLEAEVSKGEKAAGGHLDSIPSVRGGEFHEWFNSLSVDEFDQVWADPKLRDAIKDRLRSPGGLHEWHLVSRADVFKRWGVTSEQITEMRTLISETKFINPIGKHGGKGSTKAHNELLEIIDSSTDYDMFKRRLRNWANYRFEGGADALPEGLKP